MDKVLKVVKLLSLIIFLIVLLTIYAYLPKITALHVSGLETSKETFFYGALALFSLVNFLFSVLSVLFKKRKASTAKAESLRSWFLSVPIMFNFYLIFIVAYIGIINNADSINPSSYFYLVYLGPILVIGWIAVLIKVLFTKEIETS